MSRVLFACLAAGSLSGCTPSTPQPQLVEANPDARSAANQTAPQAAAAPAGAGQPEPERVYVLQPVYVYVPQAAYAPGPGQTTSGTAVYQSGCGLAGDCSRTVLTRDMDVSLDTYCTSHVFDGAMPTVQTSCY